MAPSIGSPLLWAGFAAFVFLALLLDLGVFHRQAHTIRYREAMILTLVWGSLALLFAAGVYFVFGSHRGLEFLTGYVIEYSLSIDNIFVFLLIFKYFSVPSGFQHRVLFWGILGALATRLAFILLGAALLRRFEWVTMVLGIAVVVAGIRMLRQGSVEVHPERNWALRIAKKVFPVAAQDSVGRFFLRQDGRIFATPLLLVLIVVEATDVAFAMDSIPAIFAVTRDPFIAFTSNIFAILGLRSLYFLLASVMDRFHYLKIGLGLVLAFVGGKMVAARWMDIPIGISLLIVGLLLASSVLVSLAHKSKST